MRLYKLIFSTKISLVLLLVFALSMAVATFIENDHGTEVARGLVYEAWWFEIVMVWLAVNFLAHIDKYKLLGKKKWPVGLFHIGFVVVVLGAGITRYFSEEGMIHIREGSSGDTFYTTADYLQVQQLNPSKISRYEKQLALIGQSFRPKTYSVEFPEDSFRIVIEDYIQGAREEFLDGQETYIDLAVAVGSGREDYLVTAGDQVQLEGFSLGTSREAETPVRLFKQDSAWVLETDVHLQVMEMSTQKIGVVHEGEINPVQLRSLYQWDAGAFIIKAIHENAALNYYPEKDEKLAKNLPDVVKVSIQDSGGGEIGKKFLKKEGYAPVWHPFVYGGRNYQFTFGPKGIRLPFEIYLREFELERYPGSQSPASYASEVSVVDGEKEMPYRIFMNNVLDYKGFRFYQASYDTDEKGTVLSVNQDRPGTIVTYIGYFLLTLGMVLTLFAKGSRFRILNRKLSLYKKAFLMLGFFMGISLSALPNNASDKFSVVPSDKAEAYGRLIVQDLDGRMKPLNTLAHEVIRKLSGKSYMEVITDAGDKFRLIPEQFLLAVQLDPVTYSHLPLIKIDPGKSHQAFERLGMVPQGRISFRQFLDEDGNYLLHELVEEANRLKPAERSEEHNELLKTDERFNIFYALLTGDFLRLFPNKLDKNNTWFTRQQHSQGFVEEDALFVKNITSLYMEGLGKGLEEEDWSDAEEVLSYISLYQQEAGKDVYPAPRAIKAELLYTRLNLGAKLFGPFWLIGGLMLIIGITLLFNESKVLQKTWAIGHVLAWLGLLFFTFHQILRWYIAQHPPWSDGFEMLVFVAWGVLLFGLLFASKSRFTVPLGLLFSGTLLFVGFLDWLNPEITNLMPVLHSYWLKIHVAVIVSGYAPLALSAIMALMTLVLIIFHPQNPTHRWWKGVRELIIVNEMSITVGLFLLAVGTFLGGVWANESWGRYWAWDPKETWALISVIVYAIVLHLRLVPKLKNDLVYNLASLWAFSSIIMTSFGVNYYLSGLHSYAAGDPVPVPSWVYWVIGTLLLISLAAIWRYPRLNKLMAKGK